MSADETVRIINALFPEGVYAVLAVLVVQGVRAVGGPALRYLQLHFSASQLTAATRIAAFVVREIEQVGAAYAKANPGSTWPGADRIVVATNKARSLAATVGVSLTDDQWRSLLEKAVYEMKQEAIIAGADLAPLPAHVYATLSGPEIASTASAIGAGTPVGEAVGALPAPSVAPPGV